MLFRIFITFLISFSLSSKEVILYDNDFVPSEVYEDIISKNLILEKDDEIVIAHKRFTFLKNLGAGDHTRIIEVMDLKEKVYALRLPLHLEKRSFSMHEQYLEGYYILKNQGIRIPQIFEHKENKYTIVESLGDLILLEDFINNPKNFSYIDREKAEKSFISFIKQTAPFKDIFDFHLAQVGYNNLTDKWYLFDWNAQNQLFSEITDDFIFPFKSFYEAGSFPFNGSLIENELLNERVAISLSENEFLFQLSKKMKKAKDRKELIKLIYKRPSRYSQRFLEMLITEIKLQNDTKMWLSIGELNKLIEEIEKEIRFGQLPEKIINLKCSKVLGSLIIR